MKQRILLVDDSDEIREITKHLLEDRGYEVIALHDGDQALSTTRDTTPNLILLDNILTGKSGSEICHEIKSDNTISKIPIIMTTGNISQPQENLIPPDDLLIKPFDIDDLVLKITQYLTPPA